MAQRTKLRAFAPLREALSPMIIKPNRAGTQMSVVPDEVAGDGVKLA
jgi:hypothetical protein